MDVLTKVPYTLKSGTGTLVTGCEEDLSDDYHVLAFDYEV